MKRIHSSPKCLAAAAIASALALVSVLAPSLSAQERETTWELTPYRIQLLIAAGPGSFVPRSLANDLQADLPARAAAVVGGAWQVEAAAAPPELRHALLHALADVTADRLPADARAHDKVILLAITESEAGVRASAREFDVTTGLWNSVVTRDATQPEQIAGAAFEAVLAAFAPLARIDAVEKGTATLRLKAGAIAKRDQGLAAVSSGSVFRPVLVALNDAGAIEAKTAQPVDWTLLTVTTSGGSIATCRIDSGLAGEPIPAYHPRRARLALGVAPSTTSTRLTLVSRSTGTEPLEGIEVFDIETAASGDSQRRLLGLSDRSGVVVIPPGATAMRLLDIRQGSQTLARLPIVPGMSAEVKLALDDDRQRLTIETPLAQAEDALVDLAARRQALAARIKLAKKAGDASADALLPKLRALASVDSQQALVDQADKAIQAADPSSKALLQPKLDALKKLAQNLAAQSPTSLLDEPKPAEPKPAEAKPAEAKPAEAKPAKKKETKT